MHKQKPIDRRPTKRLPARLAIRRDGVSAWLLCDPATGDVVGGINYVHAADGNHYQAWFVAYGGRQGVGDAVPQLAMAAREVEARLVETGRLTP